MANIFKGHFLLKFIWTIVIIVIGSLWIYASGSIPWRSFKDEETTLSEKITYIVSMVSIILSSVFIMTISIGFLWDVDFVQTIIKNMCSTLIIPEIVADIDIDIDSE